MSTSENNNTKSSDIRHPKECQVCRQLRLEGAASRAYRVIPADGGGWQVWSAALLRLFQRIGGQPTQAVIISQSDRNDRYVQAQIGHGIAHVEVSSNVYLMAESRLTADHEALLAELGWLPPTLEDDDPNEMPANWYLPLIRGDWQYLVEMLLTVMVGVLGFDELLPVEVRTFQCDNPCRDCSWPREA